MIWYAVVRSFLIEIVSKLLPGTERLALEINHEERMRKDCVEIRVLCAEFSLLFLRNAK